MSGHATTPNIPDATSANAVVFKQVQTEYTIPESTDVEAYQTIKGTNNPPYYQTDIHMHRVYYDPQVSRTNPPSPDAQKFNITFPRSGGPSYRVFVYNNAPLYAGYAITFRGESGGFDVVMHNNDSTPHNPGSDQQIIYPQTVKMFQGADNGGWDFF